MSAIYKGGFIFEFYDMWIYVVYIGKVSFEGKFFFANQKSDQFEVISVI